MIDVYFCFRYKFCVEAADLGYKLGTRADQFDTNRAQRLLDEGYSIDLVDNNFKDPDVQRLLNVTRKCEPELVALPDIYEESDVDRMIDVGETVEAFGATPMVVPKVEFDYTRLPSNWVIGYSVPSGYGETEIDITEFTDHPVHLLGGSHRNQLRLANEAVENDINIVSVDGNAFTKGATYGNIVNDPEILLDGGNAWNADTGHDWEYCISRSLENYIELWRQWHGRVVSETPV